MAGSPLYRGETAEVSTIGSMVVPGSQSPAGSPPPPRRRWPRWPIPVTVGVLFLFAVSFFTLPYYTVAPGSARQVNDLVRVPKDRAFPARGRIYLATVSLRRATPVEALAGWLDGDTDVVPEERILSSVPRGQFSRVNRQLMDESKQVASVVALRHLGHPVPEHGNGALVVGVEKDAPAAGHLAPDEVINSVDGRPTTLGSQAVELIRAHKPGESVRLEVRSAQGVPRVEQVTLGANPRRPGGYLGVFVETKDQRFDFPFEVKIESEDIGGPSAGLAYTLGILDHLTTGELTGGKKVAATGTIEIDGKVGNVGGVAQKTAAVRSAGAEYFLVPPDEYAEAAAHAGNELKVMKAASLAEAVAALGTLGGDVSALAAPRGGAHG